MSEAEFDFPAENIVTNMDSSWTLDIESKIKWCDKIINEFPKTDLAKYAYQIKIKTLLGSKESGRFGDSSGVMGNSSKYMPLLLESFVSFEKDFPKASSLQSFRYLIAYAYWADEKYEKTKEWLNIIINTVGEKDSIYKNLSERNLQMLK